MKLVIPMAGRGQRFLDAGITTPKMLINVRGKLIVEWALQGLSFIPKRDTIFVILKEHDENFGISGVLREKFGNDVKVCTIPAVTGGQACTVAEARHLYLPDEPLVIFNSDTYFRSPSLEASLACLGESCDGVIGVFPSKSPAYSYVRFSKPGSVAEVVEKRVISDWATSGLYSFARASDFLSALSESVQKNEKSFGEHYIGPLYNTLISNGAKIRADFAANVFDLGNPNKITEFDLGTD